MSTAARRRHSLYWLAASSAVLFIGVPTYAWYAWVHGPFDDADFDRNTWLRAAGSMDSDNPRGPMADALVDLLRERRLDHQSVIELLGPTEYPCAVLSPPRGTIETCLSYKLGMWSGFRMDPDTLDIYFNADGRVADAITVQH